MARRSAADTAATRKQILMNASESFRSQGGQVGIAKIMADAGLTQGGFYRHFGSKDDLFAEAVSSALDQVAERLERASLAAPEDKRFEAFVSAYLSPDHLDHPEVWCAIATLGPDVARLPEGVRHRLEAPFQKYAARLIPLIPMVHGDPPERRLFLLMSGMAGAIVMARIFPERQQQLQTLAWAREFYLKCFG